MPAHQKECAVTIIATAAATACRFVAYNGQHATAAGGGAGRTTPASATRAGVRRVFQPLRQRRRAVT